MVLWRLNFCTAFSTNAVSICHSAGLMSVIRVEQSTRYVVHFSSNVRCCDNTVVQVSCSRWLHLLCSLCMVMWLYVFLQSCDEMLCFILSSLFANLLCYHFFVFHNVIFWSFCDFWISIFPPLSSLDLKRTCSARAIFLHLIFLSFFVFLAKIAIKIHIIWSNHFLDFKFGFG